MTVEATESLSRLVIDHPSSGSAMSDALRIQGWAVVDGHPVLPRVLHQNQPVPFRIWPDARPDVAAVVGGDELQPHGYVGWVETGSLPAGPVTLTLEAGNLAEEIELEHRPGGVKVHIERPRGQRPPFGRIAVSGWVWTTGVPPGTVRVEGSGIDLISGVHGIRPDISKATGAPLACGFDVVGDVPLRAMGLISLAVIASDRSGAQSVGFVDGIVPHDAEPRLVIEECTQRPASVAVSGYVIWPAPPPVAASASISVDGEPSGRAFAMESRPELFWSHDAEPATLRCGFRVYAIDVPATAGQAVVTVHADDGRVATSTVSLSPGQARQISSKGVVAALQSAATPGSVVLDCCGGLDGLGLERSFQIVTPLLGDDELPYVDDSFDVVVAAGARPVSVAAAERVARAAVVVLGGDEPEVRRLRQPPSRPSVSVVMPVFGAPDITDAAIAAVLASTPAEMDLELIAVDDCDPTGAAERLAAWAERDARVRPITMAANVGYLRATNNGASEARNDVLVLLNNDCVVAPHTIATLIDTLSTFPQAGAVGGKLSYPDGRLQEAGGALFRDGRGLLIGMRSWTPDDPLFSFVRPVDYCSAALLAVPRSLWEDVEGFDDAFAPAYYEDTDLCLRLRQMGRPVLYQPTAVALHHLGSTLGRAGIERGRQRLLDRWSDVLADYPVHPEIEDLSTWRPLVYDTIDRSPPWRKL